ncbi:unnamed protein product [Rotaria socialis]
MVLIDDLIQVVLGIILRFVANIHTCRKGLRIAGRYAQQHFTDAEQWSPVVSTNAKRSGVASAVANDHLMTIESSVLKKENIELYDSESNNGKLHDGTNYCRLGRGVRVIKFQQYDSVLYRSNSIFNVLSTLSNKLKNCPFSALVYL